MLNMPDSITIQDAVNRYLDSVSLSRSENTSRTYRNGLAIFLRVLEENACPANDTLVTNLPEEGISWLASELKDMAPTTERLYLTAASNFYEFIVADNLASINLPRIKLLIRQRARRPGQRLPQFPKADIEKLLSAAQNISLEGKEENERLRLLRDSAFIISLADTGLRVHEACNLRRGSVDWLEGKAIIIGKGDRQAVIRFSSRAIKAIKAYLTARALLDGSSGRSLSSLALFARHDKGVGKKVKPITTATGRNIINDWVKQIIGEEMVGSITPHSFRHYFVTCVLQGSGNLKLAQELARHKNIAVTQRYAHLSDDELDRGYWGIFEQKE
jgi:integrase/recombinase XerC